METPKKAELAYIGKSVIIKGELSGSEDLYIDGQLEGSIRLDGNNLTIGPNGQVKADVSAKTVMVEGKIEGAIRSSDRTELRKSASATGEISTQRIAIEEGALFKGKLDVQRDEGKSAAGNK
jgi:cytoskeletal protein CcmA (bactofilin family)